MIKFTIGILIIGTALCFILGFIKIVHVVESVPVMIEEEHARQHAKDKALREWAESPTPGFDAGK